MKHMARMNEAVSIKNRFTMDGGGKRSASTFKRQEFWKCIGFILSAVTYGKKGKSFGGIYQNLLLGWHLLIYEEMFVETPIYLRYVVITIVIFTSMIAIELFYLTQLLSFLGCFF